MGQIDNITDDLRTIRITGFCSKTKDILIWKSIVQEAKAHTELLCHLIILQNP